MPFRHKHDLLGIFAQHKVACNLLMVMLILAGVWALAKLNTQFFPSFALDFVTVRVVWTGASAEDVESAVVAPLEERLRALDNLKQLTSTATQGQASVLLEYQEGTDMGEALDKVKEQVALIRDLPGNAEAPEINRIVRYEPIARVLLTGAPLARLRPYARQMERELLDRGIAQVSIVGLPDEEIAIQIPSATLHDLDTSLDAIAARVATRSRDLPAGTIGRDDVARQLRAVEQRRRAIDFENLPLLSDAKGRLVTLGDVATIERRPRAGQTRVLYRGQPAVELLFSRAEASDSLKSARILREWIKDNKSRWPPAIKLHTYDQAWQLIWERIMLLVKNGATGLLLVVAILFVFLNGRVAGWVALGIPVSFMATLGVLYALGGSINMVSLFALIMALGVIVDDAIVVGEDALAHYEGGEDPLQAAEGGARRMLAPVMSSSLTTVAAFLPLMLVGGIMGKILFDIPLVMVCVNTASLVESFLVLPGHLRHTFVNIHHAPLSPLRVRLEGGVDWFRERVFRRLVEVCVDNPWTTVSSALAMLILALGLLVGGRLAFNFFPTPEGKIVHANVSFVAGTSPRRVADFMAQLQSDLLATEARFGEPLVNIAVTRLGSIASENAAQGQHGDNLASMRVELTEPDSRSVRNAQFLKAWRQRIRLPAGIENFSLVERRPGPPGRDVEVRLSADDSAQLKAAALALAAALKTIPGVLGIEDDMPYGQEQMIYRLTPQARTHGLTVEMVGRQLRAAYDGRIAEIFQQGGEELEVRVVLPDRERHRLSSLADLSIALPDGETMPLLSAVTIDSRRGFETLRHIRGKLAAKVSADVDPAISNSNEVTAALRARVLPDIKQRYGVEYAFEGRQSDQRETLADMRRGALFALAMIYLVLAWVFASYGWPLVVMAAIPFGLIGALVGHWLLGIDLTILSLFGVFGLAGIVVNDSIIVVVFYKHLVEAGHDPVAAISEAACQRLRAVLLTSLTTIGGLMPLMFETSLQAQFLIPMAVSISFGLAFSTVLVLLVVPALLRIHEDFARRWRAARRRAAPGRKDAMVMR